LKTTIFAMFIVEHNDCWKIIGLVFDFGGSAGGGLVIGEGLIEKRWMAVVDVIGKHINFH
jgi:hypothetical protein